jgi:hypothetical protein
MGLFDEKKELRPDQINNAFKRDAGKISPYRRYSKDDRKEIAAEITDPKYGGTISREDYKRHIRDLERERSKVYSKESLRKPLDEKIKYLKEKGGL